MGIIVNIYRADCTINPGITSRFVARTMNRFVAVDKLTLTNIPGPFEPTPDAPAALLESHYPGVLRIISEDNEMRRPMFGGNFAYTSDSRFSEACERLLNHSFSGAVKIHDRYE